MPIAEIETKYFSNQLSIPDRVMVVPGVDGGMTRIWISVDAAKILPSDTKIVSLSEGGQEGDLFLYCEGEKVRKAYILIPPECPQYIDFDFDDEAFYP